MTWETGRTILPAPDGSYCDDGNLGVWYIVPLALLDYVSQSTDSALRMKDRTTYSRRLASSAVSPQEIHHQTSFSATLHKLLIPHHTNTLAPRRFPPHHNHNFGSVNFDAAQLQQQFEQRRAKSKSGQCATASISTGSGNAGRPGSKLSATATPNTDTAAKSSTPSPLSRRVLHDRCNPHRPLRLITPTRCRMHNLSRAFDVRRR
jgi:hypothetical protein